jgi:hypothetical protein
MNDQPFYAPGRANVPRQPRAGEHLWTIQKNGRNLACELRDDGAAGVELQVSRDGTCSTPNLVAVRFSGFHFAAQQPRLPLDRASSTAFR